MNELGLLISNFGVEVCKPSPAKALKFLAKLIGDRDNGIRSAALNAIVEAYNIIGVNVFTLVGKVNILQCLLVAI